MKNVNINKEDIVNELFNFIEKQFNNFNHQKRTGNETWFNPSWSPFIQTFFINWGNILEYKVGSSYTKSNLKSFWEKIFTTEYLKPPDRGFDISWHDNDYEFILGLEHEETGKKSDSRLSEVIEEIDKLRFYKGIFKIIISRPYFTTQQNYIDIEKCYKEKIEAKMKQINPIDSENWILILIGPSSRLQFKNYTDILFYCYYWNENTLTNFMNKSFRVIMNKDGLEKY